MKKTNYKIKARPIEVEVLTGSHSGLKARIYASSAEMYFLERLDCTQYFLELKTNCETTGYKRMRTYEK